MSGIILLRFDSITNLASDHRAGAVTGPSLNLAGNPILHGTGSDSYVLGFKKTSRAFVRDAGAGQG
jgi:hypothetical protein